MAEVLVIRWLAVELLESALDRWVRPLLAADGGAIEVAACSETTVTLYIRGACAGCPGFDQTRSRVIEPVVHRILGANVEVIFELTSNLSPVHAPAKRD